MDAGAAFFDERSLPLEARIATGLHKLGLALKHETWRRASAEGLSPTQGQILAAILVDGPQTGTELSERLGVTLPTISDSVAALVAKGLARKRPDPRHPRASRISLTPAGRKRAAGARAWPEFLGAAAGALSPEEQSAFFSGLVKMIRALQAAGQIPINRMCVTCKYFRPYVHEGPLPHHCAFVDAPMAARHLRLDCDDHLAAGKAEQERAWARFAGKDGRIDFSIPDQQMRSPT
jgi:DNA-binding MarR family transcriptional regulator